MIVEPEGSVQINQLSLSYYVRELDGSIRQLPDDRVLGWGVFAIDLDRSIFMVCHYRSLALPINVNTRLCSDNWDISAYLPVKSNLLFGPFRPTDDRFVLTFRLKEEAVKDSRILVADSSSRIAYVVTPLKSIENLSEDLPSDIVNMYSSFYLIFSTTDGKLYSFTSNWTKSLDNSPLLLSSDYKIQGALAAHQTIEPEYAQKAMGIIYASTDYGLKEIIIKGNQIVRRSNYTDFSDRTSKTIS